MEPFQDAVGVEQSEIRKARAKYRQPTVTPGMPIVWYRYNRPDNQPYVAFVRKRGKNETITAHVPMNATGEMMNQCRHVSDPLLRLGTDIADGGCWDFAPYYLELCTIVADLEERVAAVQRQLDGARLTPCSDEPLKTTSRGRSTSKTDKE